jgi:hypothetical protein
LEPEEIAYLRAGDHDRDAVREAEDHRLGNELDGGTESGRASMTRMTPAIIVDMNSPSMPYAR